MKSESINQYITMAANVGVLLGILLLAYELNQNNQLLAAEARATHMLIRSTGMEFRASEGDLMKLRLKYSSNEELSLDELWRLKSDAMSTFTKWEWEFDQYKDGALVSIPIGAYADDMSMYPHFETNWHQVGEIAFSAEFFAFMEENVISQL